MKETFIEDVIKRYDELDSIEDILGVGTLTLSSYMSGARAQMFTQHLLQSHVPLNGEIPRVSTRYEHMVGQYSNAFYKNDNKLKVIKRINKHEDYVYTLVVFDTKTKTYDIIERNVVHNLAEQHGYRWNNEEIDSYEEGDTIGKDTMLYKSPSFDEEENFMYGVNGKVLYVISPDTIEDAVVISESFSKKLTVTKVDTCSVQINDNDILLNMYGGKHKYKSFPDIGEWMKKSVLCATRRRDRLYDAYNLKNSKLRQIFPNDSVYQFIGNWQVVDIDIWSNQSVEDIPDVPAYAQMKKYLENDLRYWTNIYETLGEIIDSGSAYSQKLSQKYSVARDKLADDSRFTFEDRMFSNIVMEFTIAKEEPCQRGCKLSGRFGNKSVISAILPDEEMGITEDGVIPDIRVDALGVVGRLNSGQIFEQELTWIANKVERTIQRMGDPNDPKILKKQWKYLIEFLGKVDKDQKNDMLEFADKYDNAKFEIINELVEGREHILIQQKPIDCIGGDEMARLFKDYSMKKTNIYYTNDYGHKVKALRKVIVSDEYFMRLKQEPSTKYSARSHKLISSTGDSKPTKSAQNRKHKALFQDQANKIKLGLFWVETLSRINSSNCWDDLKALMPIWSENRNKLRDCI